MKKHKKNCPTSSLPSSLQQINLNAAGIDIGSEIHYVAVPADRDPNAVQRFGCFTSDLYRLADWLKKCGITTVAMESTGVYWIALFQILEERGFDVKLANARHVKNLPGRKTDVQDCQWLQQLHTFGLLHASFRPTNQVCVLRSFLRQRDNLIKSAASHVQRMQKALTQMNLQLHKVISDITGSTGLRILKAILSGERDSQTLAQLKDYRIKSSRDLIARSLEGDYRQEHLFVLQQELDLYEFYRQKITQCDQEIEKCLALFDSKVDLQASPLPSHKSTHRKPQRNQPAFDLRAHLYRLSGVDFTAVPGFDALTVQTLISEVGLDMSRWPTEKHFASWLGLCPHHRITGGRILSSRTRTVVNRAADALRLAAQTLYRSQSALGAYHRRLKARLGAPKAITATAHKLARIFYRMLKFGQNFVAVELEVYEQKFKERIIKNLQKKAQALGFALVENQQVSRAVT